MEHKIRFHYVDTPPNKVMKFSLSLQSLYYKSKEEKKDSLNLMNMNFSLIH